MRFDSALVYRFSQQLSPEQIALVEVLESIEPAVIDAGRIARRLQGEVEVEMKSHTGNIRADVVTQADRLVQQSVLETMVETPMTSCRLFAEEAPEGGIDLRGRFSTEAHLYVTVDPIDGTRRYTQNKPGYATIVGLHDDVRPIYTFVNYPSLDWWIRIVDSHITTSGDPPLVEPLSLDLDRTIVYTAGDPRDDIPLLQAQLGEAGFDFREGESVSTLGSKYLFLTGNAGGYFVGNPNPFDGLLGLHFAMARGNLVLAQGLRQGQPLDLGCVKAGRYGDYHPGWYLAVPKAATV